MSYKVGQLIITKYKNRPVPPERQYQPGQRITLTAKKSGDKIAQAMVIKSNRYRVVSRVINTYGHKRRVAVVYTEDELNEMAKNSMFVRDNL